MISGIIRLLCFAVLGMRDAARGDDHMCTISENYVETVPVTKMVPVRRSETYWCFNFYPRCTEEYTTYEPKTTYENTMKTRIIEKCCDGYLKSKANGKCLPVCSGQCLHGECLAPEVCSCDSGYYGHRCDKPCTAGFWGRGCLETCDCQNDSTCDSIHGLCDCSEGWQGVRCDVPCDGGECVETTTETTTAATETTMETTPAVTETTTEGTTAATETTTEGTTTATETTTKTTAAVMETTTETTAAATETTTETSAAAMETTTKTTAAAMETTTKTTAAVTETTTESQQRERTEDATDPWERGASDEENQTPLHYDVNVTGVLDKESPDIIISVENLSLICGLAGLVFLLVVGTVMIGYLRKARKVSYSCKSNDLRQKDIAAHALSSEIAHSVKPVFDAFTCSTSMDLETEKPRMITFKPVRGDRPLGKRTSY